MSEKKFPDTELVEPEGFWPDDPVVVHEPPDDPFDATPDEANERPTESIRFDPSTIENIGRPEPPQEGERQPVDSFRYPADADDHRAASEDPLTLPTPETARLTTDRSEDISSLEMQFDDEQAGTVNIAPATEQPEQNSASGVSADEAQPRQDPIPFESYMSGYTQPTQPLAAETSSELLHSTNDEQTSWFNQGPPAEETYDIHTEEVPTRTWLNDPPPPAPDPFSADPYSPKLDEAWLGQTAPFDEHFDPGEFQGESRDETVRRSGLAWSAGIVFFSSVAFMLFLGWLVDLLLGTAPFGMVGGIIFGSVVGFIQFFRISSRIFSSKPPNPEIRSLMSHDMEETVPTQDPHNPPYPPETYPPA